MTVHGAAASLFDGSREDCIGKVTIYEIDDTVADVVRGEVVIETAQGSEIFLRRRFEAIYLGHYLNVSHWPNPDREWGPGGVP